MTVLTFLIAAVGAEDIEIEFVPSVIVTPAPSTILLNCRSTPTLLLKMPAPFVPAFEAVFASPLEKELPLAPAPEPAASTLN